MKVLTQSETIRAANKLVVTTQAQVQKELRPSVIRGATLVLVFLIGLVVCPPLSHGQESPSLMTMIAQWQYPNSKISGATLSDAATMNGASERTLPSVQYKAVLTTKEPMAKVVAYYKAKLASAANSRAVKPGDQPAPDSDSAKSVTFHDDSQGRPVAIHVILVNTDKASTTLVISRAATESETHIAWSRYQKF